MSKSRSSPQYMKEYMRKRKIKMNVIIREIKTNNPCTDCENYFHFSAMDFDHLGDDKKFGVAQMGGSSLRAIMEEIKKCELLCSNCHRIRTWKRKNNIPLEYKI